MRLGYVGGDDSRSSRCGRDTEEHVYDTIVVYTNFSAGLCMVIYVLPAVEAPHLLHYY